MNNIGAFNVYMWVFSRVINLVGALGHLNK